jgi:hypothetical protein
MPRPTVSITANPAKPRNPNRKSWKELQVERAGGLLSAKDALKQLDCPLKTATLFDLMRWQGMLFDGERPSSAGDAIRKFPALTARGEQFGANIPGFHPAETEMAFHPEKLPLLLAALGEALVALGSELQGQQNCQEEAGEPADPLTLA